MDKRVILGEIQQNLNATKHDRGRRVLKTIVQNILRHHKAIFHQEIPYHYIKKLIF